ncbi:MAG: MFS transporter [Anaeroplasmataceae bacterium]
MNKGYKKFLILWIGELISQIGSGLTSFGLGIYVFKATGSATSMALVTLCGFLPSLILSIFAGVLADKYDRRLMMILGDGLSGMGILFILVMMILNKCEVWHIYVGLLVSSTFSSLMQPAFNATITDLVGKDNYTKASGLVSIASSSKFLISPLLAGILLSYFNIELLLIMDICTFIITVAVTLFIKRGIITETDNKATDMRFYKEGFKEVFSNKGILALVIVASFINLFMGFIQVLSESLVLGFTSTKVYGICESVSASGMLVASIIIGAIGIKKHHKNKLAVALIMAGLAMIGFGLTDNIYIIIVFGFLFFMTLPVANTALDYLVRSNIENEKQGRVWGVIGFLSQIGSVISFTICGVLADCISKIFDISVSRASGYVISGGGVFLAIIAISIFAMKSISVLERNANLFDQNNNSII